MDASANYKVRHVELLVERAFNIRWTPEIERRDEATLETLWTSLTAQERTELALWLAQQKDEPELD